MFELPSDDEVNEVLGQAQIGPEEVIEDSVEDIEIPEDTDEDKVAAAKAGWKEPDGEKFKKTAKQFLADGELIRKLEDMADERREQKKMIEMLLARSEKSEKIAYEKAYRDIEAKRAEAFENQDATAFQEYDKELRKMDVERVATPSVENFKEVERDFEIRNKDWYDITDPDKYELVLAAQRESERLNKVAPNLSFQENLNKVEQYIKKKYSNHSAFSNPNRSSPAKVSSSEAPVKSSNAVKLTAHQEKAYRAIKDKLDPSYTREQYLKDRG